MARFMPNSPPHVMTPVVAKSVRALKSLPEDRYMIWHHLSIWNDVGPDFLLITKDHQVALLKVSDASAKDVSRMNQPTLLTDETDGGRFGEKEAEAFDAFFRDLPDSILKEDLEQIPCMVLFPNLRTKDLRQAARVTGNTHTLWVAGDELKPDRLGKRMEKCLLDRVSSGCFPILRKAFSPEVVIPSSFTVRAPIDRKRDAELTEYLLDYDQEWLLKSDLNLNDSAKRTSNDFSVRLINGVAGSGKSLIIVYRALLLRRLFPQKRILVLTHNRPLIQDLAARYAVLSNNDEGVEWRTFMDWCMSLYPNSFKIQDRIGREAREELIADVCHEHFEDTTVTPTMLESEIDWFKDQLITSRDSYLQADRSGRGFALQESMRERMYDAMLAYSKRLQQRSKTDWGGVPKRLWNMLEKGEVDLPTYDAILIDEAQFFAPIWFEIMKRTLNPNTGHLFLVADPTQGFLKRRQTWLSSGLDVRGRSYRLDRSYRTTRQILAYATNLYHARVPSDDEDLVAPNLYNMPAGVVPFILSMSSPQDETARVVNEIANLIDAGMPLGHILVIHTEWSGVADILARLKEKYGPDAVVDPKGEHRRDQLRVCTLNAATGLESPIVFLVGLNKLHEQEQSLRISDEERAELIRDNTRKIYMAITRAGQRVVITYCGALPKWLVPVQ